LGPDKTQGDGFGWTVDLDCLRAGRVGGQWERHAGLLAQPPHLGRAETIEIDGPAESIPLRLVRPKGTPRGVFLHIHGGGWMLGGADQQDPLLERIADAASVISLSVDYRLAPEDPYPAGPDDCEAAALWLAKNAQGMFGTERLLIGGDSAGAHLSLVTLLRLRDRHGLTPFSAVMFDAGCFDLRLTPSVRSWGDDPLILNTLDIRNFVSGFVQNQSLLEEPDVSPLLADLSGLPPALFNVGTLDPLVDDSLMMAARWTAAGNAADLAIWPGGAHVFTVFPGAQADAARARIDAFLTAAAMGVSA
ncbi:MAG: alpha/beta hydrolase, partial [Pseudomonadota bacterium]